MNVEKQPADAANPKSESDPLVKLRFQPQEKVFKFIINSVKPKGETEWTAPLSQVLEMCGGELPEDDDYTSDELRYLDQAPEWVKDWEGPFYVAIENRLEIEEFLEARAEAPAPSAEI